jgi:hypothetical protein
MRENGDLLVPALDPVRLFPVAPNAFTRACPAGFRLAGLVGHPGKKRYQLTPPASPARRQGRPGAIGVPNHHTITLGLGVGGATIPHLAIEILGIFQAQRHFGLEAE